MEINSNCPVSSSNYPRPALNFPPAAPVAALSGRYLARDWPCLETPLRRHRQRPGRSGRGSGGAFLTGCGPGRAGLPAAPVPPAAGLRTGPGRAPSGTGPASRRAGPVRPRSSGTPRPSASLERRLPGSAWHGPVRSGPRRSRTGRDGPGRGRAALMCVRSLRRLLRCGTRPGPGRQRARLVCLKPFFEHVRVAVRILPLNLSREGYRFTGRLSCAVAGFVMGLLESSGRYAAHMCVCGGGRFSAARRNGPEGSRGGSPNNRPTKTPPSTRRLRRRPVWFAGAPLGALVCRLRSPSPLTRHR